MRTIKIQKKQKGFTLIEVGVAIAIGVLFLAGIAGLVISSLNDSKVAEAQNFFSNQAPQALVAIVRTEGSIAGATKAKLVAKGLDTNTPWDAAWTMSVAAGVATFTFPIGGNDPDTTGADMAAGLTTARFPHLSANATYAAATDKLTVKIAL